jgi:hypothetical protein
MYTSSAFTHCQRAERKLTNYFRLRFINTGFQAGTSLRNPTLKLFKQLSAGQAFSSPD